MEASKPVLDILRPLGLTSKYIGVVQLSMAVQLLLENPERIFAVKDGLYSVIAERFSVQWKTVERNIRTITQLAWEKHPDRLTALMGYPLSKRPTTSEFIEMVWQRTSEMGQEKKSVETGPAPVLPTGELG